MLDVASGGCSFLQLGQRMFLLYSSSLRLGKRNVLSSAIQHPVLNRLSSYPGKTEPRPTAPILFSLSLLCSTFFAAFYGTTTARYYLRPDGDGKNRARHRARHPLWGRDY